MHRNPFGTTPVKGTEEQEDTRAGPWAGDYRAGLHVVSCPDPLRVASGAAEDM